MKRWQSMQERGGTLQNCPSKIKIQGSQGLFNLANKTACQSSNQVLVSQKSEERRSYLKVVLFLNFEEGIFLHLRFLHSWVRTKPSTVHQRDLLLLFGFCKHLILQYFSNFFLDQSLTMIAEISYNLIAFNLVQNCFNLVIISFIKCYNIWGWDWENICTIFFGNKTCFWWSVISGDIKISFLLFWAVMRISFWAWPSSGKKGKEWKRRRDNNKQGAIWSRKCLSCKQGERKKKHNYVGARLSGLGKVDFEEKMSLQREGTVPSNWGEEGYTF